MDKEQIRQFWRPPKHDYDSDDLYMTIYDLAHDGANDSEIALDLGVTPELFSKWLNGKYDKWSEEENAHRSHRLVQVLTRARAKINQQIRGKFLSVALGDGATVERTTTTEYIRSRCPCDGKNPDCPNCGGTGWIRLTNKQKATEITTTRKNNPDKQAMATWLHHHDPEWRKYDNSKYIDGDGRSQQVDGININVVYNKKEDLEQQERKEVKDDPKP